MGELRYAHRILVKNPELLRRPLMCRRKDNIKTRSMVRGCLVDTLAHNIVHWRTLVNAAMYFRVP
jgi:hypothetical protein